MTFSGSTAYGAVSNYGTLTLTNCTISHNNTGGYFATPAGLINHGTAMLIDCTVSDNTEGGHYNAAGAGVYNYGTLTLTNSTISGNYASADGVAFGGGLENVGTATLTDCTVTGNSAGPYNGTGGGLVNSGTLTLANTIVAGNTAATGPDVSGGVTSSGNNLIGVTDGSSGWVGSDLIGTSAQPLNPLLAPLGNYGGRTQSLALLPGSPAIDAGNNALIPKGVTTDQRGLPRIVNGQVDIGAFESSGFTISVTSGTGQSTGVNTAFPAPLVVTVTANNPIEPVSGGLVTFTPPASGASATLTGSPAAISGSGTASVTATANGSAGSYSVSAMARGITTPATFSLTNTTASGAAILSTGFTIDDILASANEAALMSVLPERQSADSSRSPFGVTTSGAGGSPNGGNERDYGASVLGNGTINQVTAEPAGAAVDGFFADAAWERTTSNDLETGEHLTNS
jgi:hypothetical protein